MPAERLSMRQIHEVLRLRFASRLPQRAIAKSLGLSQGAVSGYLSRARAAGIVWPLSPLAPTFGRYANKFSRTWRPASSG